MTEPGNDFPSMDDLDKQLAEFRAFKDTDDEKVSARTTSAEIGRGKIETLEDIRQSIQETSFKKMLIVQGVHVLRLKLKKLLQPHYIILEAENVKTALSIIQKDKPDIVFADNILPDANGLDIVRLMRRWENYTPGRYRI